MTVVLVLGWYLTVMALTARPLRWSEMAWTAVIFVGLLVAFHTRQPWEH
jgi:hypothetical protein